jgi:predicted DsbA family dithiol-disulfide isomerase
VLTIGLQSRVAKDADQTSRHTQNRETRETSFRRRLLTMNAVFRHAPAIDARDDAASFVPNGAAARADRLCAHPTQRRRLQTAKGAGMRRVEVFADALCPFAYVGLRRLLAERDARGADVHVVMRAWPLEWINGRPLDPKQVAAHIEALRDPVAPDLFAGFDAAAFPTTSIPAFGLATAAYKVGADVGEAVSLALREAVFEHGRDVGDDAVLRSIGWRYGVEPVAPPVAAESTLADWERGRVLGVRGSPHFFSDGNSWFCPSLRIANDGDDYDIHVDVRSLEAFYRETLGPAAA